MDSRKITDPLNRGMVGGLLGMPADMLNMLRNGGRSIGNLANRLAGVNAPTAPMVENPVYGQEWWGNKMQQAGYVSPNRNKLAEFGAGLLDPGSVMTDVPMLAKGLFALGDPALQTITKGLLAKKAYDVAPDAINSAARNLSAPPTLNNPAFMGQRGAIKAEGWFPKKTNYPEQFSGQVVTPIIGSLPESSVYDKSGMFWGDAAANGQIRKLLNGDYLMTVTPQWMGNTKPFYAVGDIPEELASRGKEFMANSGRSIQSARTAKIPANVRKALEGEFGKNFSYDISNSGNSKSYYITHNPSGTKIRVSDHELPEYYENSADLDLRQYEVGDIVSRIKRHLAGE